MKTIDFIAELNKLNYVGSVTCKKKSISIETRCGGAIAKVRRDMFCAFDTDCLNFYDLGQNRQRELFALCSEYALTPLDQREEKESPEEKRYRLFLDHLPYSKHYRYLNYAKDTGRYFIDSSVERDECQTTFTQSEIDRIKEKYSNHVLDSFTQEEVKE